ncbi:hypothetical protein B484DRAFT_208887, partial [Ochromonadaceae sp. CCMP2298]
MYQPISDQNGWCMLGETGSAITTHADTVATATKIGGYAVWHDAETAPRQGELLCGSCSSGANVVLVAQLYAPVECDRSLYVFCCNTRSCSLKSAGWRVVRNQRETSKKVKGGAVVGKKQHTPKGEQLGVFPAPSPAGAISKSVWSDLGTDGGVGDIDEELERMLLDRDKALGKSASPLGERTAAESGSTSGNGSNSVSSTVPALAPPAPPSSSARYVTPSHLQAWAVSEVEEIWAQEDEEAAREGLQLHLQTAARKEASHIDRLLQSYYEGEEDPAVLQILKNQHSGAANARTTVDDAVEDGGEDGAAAHVSKRRSDSDSTDASLRDAGAAEEVEVERAMSRSSRREQVEAYFQRRVAYYPSQVLRYAFGGEPLWITHPSPLT